MTTRLRAIRSGDAPEVITNDGETPIGGPILVDHEGTLWMGMFRGLLQLPEPETPVFNATDGLPGLHTHFLLQTDDSLWSRRGRVWAESSRLKAGGQA